MPGTLRISVSAVATGVALAALVVAPASAAGSGNPYIYWHRTYQADRHIDNSVISVAVASKHEFWAVDQGGTERNTLLRWNGRGWRTVAGPDHFADPMAVAAPSPQDVWITGFASRSSYSPAALHWNGSHWRKITMPMLTVTPLTVLGPNDVWTAAAPSFTRSAGWHSLLWHWNGARWRSYRLPVVVSSNPIAGSSDHNLWAFGEATRSDLRGARGKLMTYRWRDGRWQTDPAPRRQIRQTPQVAMSRSGEIWLVTTAAKLSHGLAPTELLVRSRRGKWRQISTGGLGLGQPEPDGLGDAWFGGIIYYTGVGVSWLAGNATEVSHCAGGVDTVSPAAGIPGSHSVLIGGWCMPRKGGRYQGLIMISKPQ